MYLQMCCMIHIYVHYIPYISMYIIYYMLYVLYPIPLCILYQWYMCTVTAVLWDVT